MSGKMRRSLLGLVNALILIVAIGFLAVSALGQNASSARPGQQPLFGDYKGARIGMPATEVRAKLGKPTIAADDQDYYIISQNETVQIAYDNAHKAKAISIDFIDGIGAPDYKAVVGPDVQPNPDGSIHKLITYESLGFWVSYNREVGGVTTVTITIQRIL